MAKDGLRGVGYFFLLLVVWWFAVMAQLMWPLYSARTETANLAFVLALFPGTFFGIPVVLYFIWAYLGSRLATGIVGITIYLIIVVIGFSVAGYFLSVQACLPALPVALAVFAYRLIVMSHEQDSAFDVRAE